MLSRMSADITLAAWAGLHTSKTLHASANETPSDDIKVHMAKFASAPFHNDVGDLLKDHVPYAFDMQPLHDQQSRGPLRLKCGTVIDTWVCLSILADVIKLATARSRQLPLPSDGTLQRVRCFPNHS